MTQHFFLRTILWMALIGLVFGCSEGTKQKDSEQSNLKNGEPQELTVSQSPKPYVYKGDFSGIEELGTIRIIAPRFDGANALPRSGLSTSDYQGLVAEFVKSINLKIEWVYVDNFEALIPALVSGRGDVIATNMTVTKGRSSQVGFTKAIAQVSEVLIARADSSISTLDDLRVNGKNSEGQSSGERDNKSDNKNNDERDSKSSENIDAKTSGTKSGIKVALEAGTAYLETFESEDLIRSVVTVERNSNDNELLAGVSSGLYDATVLDSDIARILLKDYPKLSVKFTIKKNRPIAWAVRTDSPVLLSKLNEFLVSHHVKEASNLFERRDWTEIKASGRIRMLTVNNPASYFMWRGELMGFDYELMKAFANKHNLHLAVVLKNSIPELFEALKKGEGDVIAASLTRSDKRTTAGITFSRRYLKVNEQLVGKKEEALMTSLAELNGRTVGLNPDTVFYEHLLAKLPKDHTVNIIAVNDATTEELIGRMVEGEFDFTIADSHLVALEKSYHQNVSVSLELTESSAISWAIREEKEVGGGLKTELDAFSKKEYRGLFYNVVFNKYFKNTRKIKQYQQGRVFPDGKLSPYDDLVKELASKYKMDWRLLISQMYQESKFNPKAKSFAGAQGLMQVMPRTAKELGYSNLYEPVNGVSAGIVYMDWLEDRFPGELDFQERIFFTLAAYNAGTGHVRDARKLAKKLGYDQNKWFDNVEKAMLKLAKPKYYKNARFGYVRGSEPVQYVRKIHDRYLGYLQSS